MAAPAGLPEELAYLFADDGDEAATPTPLPTTPTGLPSSLDYLFTGEPLPEPKKKLKREKLEKQPSVADTTPSLIESSGGAIEAVANAGAAALRGGADFVLDHMSPFGGGAGGTKARREAAAAAAPPQQGRGPASPLEEMLGGAGEALDIIPALAAGPTASALRGEPWYRQAVAGIEDAGESILGGGARLGLGAFAGVAAAQGGPIGALASMGAAETARRIGDSAPNAPMEVGAAFQDAINPDNPNIATATSLPFYMADLALPAPKGLGKLMDSFGAGTRRAGRAAAKEADEAAVILRQAEETQRALALAAERSHEFVETTGYGARKPEEALAANRGDRLYSTELLPPPPTERGTATAGLDLFAPEPEGVPRPLPAERPVFDPTGVAPGELPVPLSDRAAIHIGEDFYGELGLPSPGQRRAAGSPSRFETMTEPDLEVPRVDPRTGKRMSNGVRPAYNPVSGQFEWLTAEQEKVARAAWAKVSPDDYPVHSGGLSTEVRSPRIVDAETVAPEDGAHQLGSGQRQLPGQGETTTGTGGAPRQPRGPAPPRPRAIDETLAAGEVARQAMLEAERAMKNAPPLEDELARAVAEADTKPAAELEQSVAAAAHGEAPPQWNKDAELPGWARDEMVSRGLDPARPLNDIDRQMPSMRDAIMSDPEATAAEKARTLATGSARPPPPSTKAQPADSGVADAGSGATPQPTNRRQGPRRQVDHDAPTGDGRPEPPVGERRAMAGRRAEDQSRVLSDERRAELLAAHRAADDKASVAMGMKPNKAGKPLTEAERRALRDQGFMAFGVDPTKLGKGTAGAVLGGLAGGVAGADEDTDFNLGTAALGAVAGAGAVAGMARVHRMREIAEATALLHKFDRSLGGKTTADFMVKRLIFRGATPERAAATTEHVFAKAGRMYDGSPLGMVAQAAGKTPEEAEKLTRAANRYGNRDPLADPVDEMMDAASPGGKSSSAQYPGVPPPGSAAPTGAGAGNLAAEFDKPVSTLYPVHIVSPINPMDQDVARVAFPVVEHTNGLIRDARTVEAALVEHGGNEAAALIHPALKDAPSVSSIFATIPKRWRAQGKVVTALFENRLDKVVTSAAERAAILADKGMSDAKKMYDRFVKAMAEAEGLPAGKARPDYFPHILDKKAALRSLEADMKAVAATPPSAARDVEIVRLKAEKAGIEAKGPKDTWIERNHGLATNSFISSHVKREDTLRLYLDDDPRKALEIRARMASRKIAAERKLPELGDVSRWDALRAPLKAVLTDGVIVRTTAPEGIQAIVNTVMGKTVAPQRYKLSGLYKHVIQTYVDNALFGGARNAVGDAWLQSVTVDMFKEGTGSSYVRDAISTLQKISVELGINKNPAFLLNSLQQAHVGPAVLGDKFYASALKQVSGHILSKAARGNGSRIVQAVVDGAGLSDQVSHGIKVQKLIRDADGAVKVLKKAIDNASFYRSEIFNNMVIGTGAATQFRALADEVGRLAKTMRATGQKVTVESLAQFAAKSKLDDAKVGRSLFFQDRYLPVEEQLRQAASAVLTDTVDAAARRRATHAIDMTIFATGPQTRSYIAAKVPLTQPLLTFTNFFGKQTNMAWTRLTPRGKVKWMSYPFLFGGAKAIPVVGAVAASVPAVDAWIGEVEEGRHGKLTKAMMNFNILGGLLDKATPSMANPLGYSVPFLGPNMSTAKSGWGRKLTGAASIAGPGARMILGTLVPGLEGAAFTERPEGVGETLGATAGAIRHHGRQATPIGKAAKNWTNPDFEGADKLFAFFSLTPKEQERQWSRIRYLTENKMGLGGRGKTDEAMNEDQARRYYTFERLADLDIDVAKFWDDINVEPHVDAALKGLEINRRSAYESMKRRGEPMDVRALAELRVDKGSVEDALGAWETALQRVQNTKGADNKASVFIKLGTPYFLRAIEAAEDTAWGNKDDETRALYNAARTHIEARLDDAGVQVDRLKPLRRPDGRPRFDAMYWLEDNTKKLPAGNNNALKRALEAQADKLAPENRRAAYAFINGKHRVIGLERYREKLLWSGK